VAGQHGFNGYVAGSVLLLAGQHTIGIDYFQVRLLPAVDGLHPLQGILPELELQDLPICTTSPDAGSLIISCRTEARLKSALSCSVLRRHTVTPALC